MGVVRGQVIDGFGRGGVEESGRVEGTGTEEPFVPVFKGDGRASVGRSPSLYTLRPFLPNFFPGRGVGGRRVGGQEKTSVV